jgi:hypothetical protein
MLRHNGKFLYVITGSHIDFASHVASYAIGPDWKDLFDIVIFFARKPSFFVENRFDLMITPLKSFVTLHKDRCLAHDKSNSSPKIFS